MKSLFLTIAVILMGMMSASTARAQDFCDLYSQIPNLTDCYFNENAFGFTINACGPLRFEYNNQDGTLTVNDRVFDSSLDGLNAYSDFVSDLCGTGAASGIMAGSPTDPRTQQALQSLQSRMTNQRLVPAEVQSEGGVVLALQMLNGNIGTGNFSADGVKGKSSSATMGYARELSSGYSLGTTVAYNRLSFDNLFDDLTNTSVNIYGEKAMKLWGFDAAAGVGYSHLFIDEALGDDSNGVNLYLSGTRSIGKSQLFSDFQVQYSKAGDLEQQTTTLSTLYGFPLGNRGALNADVSLISLTRKFDGRTIPGDDFFTATGLVYDHYVGDFVIKIGARKVFLLEGYSNIDYVLSGGLRY